MGNRPAGDHRRGPEHLRLPSPRAVPGGTPPLPRAPVRRRGDHGAVRAVRALQQKREPCTPDRHGDAGRDLLVPRHPLDAGDDARPGQRGLHHPIWRQSVTDRGQAVARTQLRAPAREPRRRDQRAVSAGTTPDLLRIPAEPHRVRAGQLQLVELGRLSRHLCAAGGPDPGGGAPPPRRWPVPRVYGTSALPACSRDLLTPLVGTPDHRGGALAALFSFGSTGCTAAPSPSSDGGDRATPSPPSSPRRICSVFPSVVPGCTSTKWSFLSRTSATWSFSPRETRASSGTAGSAGTFTLSATWTKSPGTSR